MTKAKNYPKHVTEKLNLPELPDNLYWHVREVPIFGPGISLRKKIWIFRNIIDNMIPISTNNTLVQDLEWGAQQIWLNYLKREKIRDLFN